MIIECDELYLGDREKNKHESKKAEETQGGKMLVNSYMVSYFKHSFFQITSNLQKFFVHLQKHTKIKASATPTIKITDDGRISISDVL